MADPIRRVHYFPGQLLTTEDLQAEQDYHRRMRWLSNRLHGWGIVEGFEVHDEFSDFVVEPGFAIDPLGREIVLTEQSRVSWTPSPSGAVVWLTWGEEPDSLVAGDDPYAPAFTRWLERPRLSVEPLGAPMPESLLLYRLYPTEGTMWTSDAMGRPVLSIPPPTVMGEDV